MNKEIQLLHIIFELELAPPFNLVISENRYNEYIYNKHSDKIGWYTLNSKCFYVSYEKSVAILKKIKQMFSADKLSKEDVHNIAKQLFNWLKGKFPKTIEIIRICYNRYDDIYYRN